MKTMPTWAPTLLASLCAMLGGYGVARADLADSREGRWWLAGLIVLAYLALCVVTAVKVRRTTRRQQSLWNEEAAAQSLLLVFASQTGFAEQLALQSAQCLRRGGLAVRVLPLARLTEDDLCGATRALFIASTTGEGDAPDMAAGFAQRMQHQAAPLPQLSFGVLALGDRSYTQYCVFGHALARWLQRRQARPLFDVVEVDNGDEGALRHWQHQLGVIGGHPDQGHWSSPSHGRWRLAERRLLNPGSLGQPAFHLALTPLDLPAPGWQAGDIAEIAPRNGEPEIRRFMTALALDDAGLVEPLAALALPASGLEELQGLSGPALLARLSPLPDRQYSIASLAQDGTLDLLVRGMVQADGRPGIGSGWLTRYAPVGATIALRIRRNSGFHAPPDDRPLVLVGNGTGLAGLRAHARARVAAGHYRNWLVFGERSRAHDWFYRDEIEHWHAQGQLQRLDLAFSRDGEPPVYVQDRLRQAAEPLRAWIAQGAAIYVCGSLQGMAAGVTQALQEIVGEQALIELAEQGRYRRDVY
ncbi:flavodoxin domain-containing protein [Herbaspirillum sp. YR522]|uniref:sulfite reductase subunit alpha n=1 Tax=Herbaspirillum sp. YR522 TaxID=1144342 RepID=UPI00026FB376|nr:flavodoxin domain-containing protein [Herbaspirillum sp. YR522]EJN06165.1 sulfite reductase, alpha subunit (flavoprotein) [Herbaspirillum sp. YR522]